MRRPLLFVGTSLLLASLFACEPSTSADPGDATDGGSGDSVNGDGDAGVTWQTDCSACTDDQVCWWEAPAWEDHDFYYCSPWPEVCDTDRTCDCLTREDAETGELPICDNIHGSCEEVEGRPVVYCEVSLG